MQRIVDHTFGTLLKLYGILTQISILVVGAVVVLTTSKNLIVNRIGNVYSPSMGWLHGQIFNKNFRFSDDSGLRSKR